MEKKGGSGAVSWGSVLLGRKIQVDKPAKETGKVGPGRQEKTRV